jgi:endonuclease/exonuclease/phosphatase family metal-dependent hydrolase
MTAHPPDTLRVATYNIHKGVQGLGPSRRLEIHNLAHAVEQIDADVVCLQEVRKQHRRLEQRFVRWPEEPQADYLAPEGYEAVYRTNAYTRHGEHGNALLTRWPVVSHQHEDMSDHRLEQRGLLHVHIDVAGREVHVIVVHLGLVPASRIRQVAQLRRYIEREVPADTPLAVAGDFNDWGMRVRRDLTAHGLLAFDGPPLPTYPSRLPIAQLDHIYVRGLRPLQREVPRGRIWSRMSDHLPLIADFGF